MTHVGPGSDHAIATCGAPGCEWHREAIGKRDCDRMLRQAQAHADRKGHPIAVDHKHSVIVDLNK